MSSIEPGSPAVVALPWDSEFFGFPIARVTSDRLQPPEPEQILAWCRERHVRCLYLFADPSSTGTLIRAHEAGFRFVDLRIDFALELSAATLAPAPAGFRSVTAEELCRLEAIARMAHTDARFFKDPGFPADRAAELYAEWIRRDYRVHRIFTLPGNVDAALAGYVTCQIDPASKTGRIGLIAVAEGEKGRGLGRALVHGALGVFREAGCHEVRVTTQGSNLVAQRLYQAAGFRTAEVSATFHRWF